MNSRIKGVFPAGDDLAMVDIFGYTTKGIPGLEILGMGKSARIVKEKFIYLTRKMRGPNVMRRYVLCVEADQRLEAKNREWLEFPLLVLFLNLRGQLLMKSLEQHYASGRVSVSGAVSQMQLGKEYLEIQRMRGLSHVDWSDIKKINQRSTDLLIASNFS